MRAVLRATQLVEQLVEVPTKISFPMILVYHALMAQRTVEQNVDIPAVGGIGTGRGPSGFLPGQSSSVTAEQIVKKLQFLGLMLLEIYKVCPVDRVQQRFRSRSLCFPIQVAAVKIFSQSTAPQCLAGQGFFCTSPKSKKCDQPPHLRSELPPRRRKRRRSARRTLSEWVPARQRYCWWLTSADGSQVGHAIWRPPWLIGRGPG